MLSIIVGTVLLVALVAIVWRVSSGRRLGRRRFDRRTEDNVNYSLIQEQFRDQDLGGGSNF